MTKQAKLRAAIVTTAHRGVFYGFLPMDTSVESKIVTIQRAKMCVYWTTDVHGVLGLAATGPTKGCRISPEIPAITLQDVTSIMQVTPEAEEAWSKVIWAN